MRTVKFPQTFLLAKLKIQTSEFGNVFETYFIYGEINHYLAAFLTKICVVLERIEVHFRLKESVSSNEKRKIGFRRDDFNKWCIRAKIFQFSYCQHFTNFDGNRRFRFIPFKCISAEMYRIANPNNKKIFWHFPKSIAAFKLKSITCRNDSGDNNNLAMFSDYFTLAFCKFVSSFFTVRSHTN